jgi:hypothetical protein
MDRDSNLNLGDIMAGFLDAFKGTEARTENVPLFNQGQQGLQNQALQQLLQLLQGTGGLEGFKPIEDQARANYQQQTVPVLAERFANLGQSGANGSSPAYRSQQYGSRQNFDLGLAGLKSQYGQNQLQNLLPFAAQQSFQPVQHARIPGFGEQAASGLANFSGPLLALLGAYFGAPGLGGGGNNNQQQPQQPQSIGGGNSNNFMQTYGQKPLSFGQSPNINF